MLARLGAKPGHDNSGAAMTTEIAGNSRGDRVLAGGGRRNDAAARSAFPRPGVIYGALLGL